MTEQLTTRIQEEIAPILQEELQKAMSNVLPEWTYVLLVKEVTW